MHVLPKSSRANASFRVQGSETTTLIYGSPLVVPFICPVLVLSAWQPYNLSLVAHVEIPKLWVRGPRFMGSSDFGMWSSGFWVLGWRVAR